MLNFMFGILVAVALLGGFNLYAPKILTGVCYGGRADNSVIEMPRMTITNFDGPGDKQIYDVHVMEVGTLKRRLALLIGEIKKVECPKQLQEDFHD